MARLFRDHPDALARTLEIADACRFSLDELRYDYPIDPVPDGMTPQSRLEQLAREGAHRRYPDGVPERVSRLLAHELALIGELRYAPYFLTVHDIVLLCPQQGHPLPGPRLGGQLLGLLLPRHHRGRSRPVRPAVRALRLGRAQRAARHRRRFRARAARGGHPVRLRKIRPRACRHRRDRDPLPLAQRDPRGRQGAGALGGRGECACPAASGAGATAASTPSSRASAASIPTSRACAWRSSWHRELTGFPRHLSQHVGGFVLTRSRLDEVVPIANAAMADRTVVEWDKDDLDALGILKIDVLALGMLTCIRKAFALLEQHEGRQLTLATVPAEDPAVYAMLGRADSIGVFQVESRAQMTMLPRLKPRCFYDLVIEVAIVRPGPIQGDMVHPYLRRRSGQEPVEYPSDALRAVLEKTLGVPLFQEQAMNIAIVGAGFTPSEADQLRRAMATFRRVGTIHLLRDKFIDGMVGERLRARLRRALLQADRGFRHLRLSGIARDQLRAPGLRLVLAEMPPPGRVRLRAAEQPADGFLCASPDRARRARPRRRRAAGRRQRQRLGLHFGSRPRTARISALRLGFRQVKGLKQEEMERLVAAARQRLSRSGDLAPSRRGQRRRARSPGARRRLRLARPGAPRRAVVGDRARPHRPGAGPAAPVRLGRRCGARRARGRLAADDARRGGGAGLRQPSPVAALPSHGPAAPLARPARGQGRAARLVRQRPPGRGRRHHPGPPAPGHRQRRDLRHPRGRDRRRQSGGLARACSSATGARF